MSQSIQNEVVQTIRHELSQFKREWWAFLLLGMLLVVGGIACIAYPFFSTIGVVVFLGVTMMISGAALIISAFWTGRWGGFLLQVLSGLFYFMAGFIIADYPVASAAIFTLMIAGFLVVTGIFRILLALTERFPQWGWVLFNGIISLLFGMIIFKSFREFQSWESASVLWIIGLLVGIELLFNGLAWVMLAFKVKGLPDLDDDRELPA